MKHPPIDLYSAIASRALGSILLSPLFVSA